MIPSPKFQKLEVRVIWVASAKVVAKLQNTSAKKKYPVYFTLSWFYDMLKQVNLKTGSWLS
jgi:hypothetical protein